MISNNLLVRIKTSNWLKYVERKSIAVLHVCVSMMGVGFNTLMKSVAAQQI